MSKELYKMNLISAVQQLPSEDIELVQNYVEMIEEENEELKKQQQEFIKYLEDYQYGASKSLDSYDCGINDCLGDVISKYKEIIGVKDEKES